MKKEWGLTKKILNGQKKIESRWYSVKYKPYDNITKGDIVYFKDSGEPVKIKTEVVRVIQFSGLIPEKVKEILEEYGDNDGIKKERIPEFYNLFKDKKYCILIFLKNPQKITPFNINKKGFGLMASWVTVKSINEVTI